MISGVVPRCLAVWVAVTAAAAAVARWSLSGWGELLGSGSFVQLLAGVAGLALAGCALWAWLVTSAVVVQAVRGARLTVRGVPAWAARAVLLACGVALVGAGPVAASDGSRVPAPDLHGLPYPDRPTGPVRNGPSDAAPAPSTYVVRAGDTLWAIAADQLPTDAAAAEVAAATAHLHDLNRDVVGADPDVIHPGLRLRTTDDRRPR